MTPPYRKILCATDLSEASVAAWPHAVRMAQAFGAELCAVVVIEEPYALAAYEGYPAFLKAIREIRPQVEAQLAEATKDVPAAVRVKRVVLEAPSPATAILEQARKEGSDLIVVSTHGRSGLGHLLLGSVAEKLLRISPVPVLVVRGPKP